MREICNTFDKVTFDVNYQKRFKTFYVTLMIDGAQKSNSRADNFVPLS